MIKLLFLLLCLFYANSAFAIDIDKVMVFLDIVTNTVINAGRLVGLIIFGVSWICLSKSQDNPNQYSYSKCLWGMLTGILMLMAGVLYSATDNTLQDNHRPLENSFLAMDTNALRALAGNGASNDGILSMVIPADTMILILGALYLIGVTAFIKGIYALKDSGDHNTGGGSPITSAIVFMASGYIAMNITFFGCGIAELFDFNLLCPNP